MYVYQLPLLILVLYQLGLMYDGTFAMAGEYQLSGICTSVLLVKKIPITALKFTKLLGNNYEINL